MIFTYKEVYKKYGNDYGIKMAIHRGEIFKINRGIYSEKRNVNPLVFYSKKYPKSIITMDTAFYYYGLTDFISDKVYLAIGKHARVIKDENVVALYVDESILNYGKITVLVENETVNIYDKERLLVELVRKKNQISFDYYKEIISNYRKIADELDMSKIEKYMSLYKNELNIGNSLLREVF